MLDDCIPYNTPGQYASYYKESNVDQFLNNQYYAQLSKNLKRLIVESKIAITTKNAIDTHKNETEIIIRNIFLLSANEVNASLGGITVKEGDELSFFKSIKNRVATFENLEKSSWMLRTPALRDSNTIIGVGGDGSVGIGGINSIDGLCENALRPVFCLSSTTPIILYDDVVADGQSVFCVKKDF